MARVEAQHFERASRAFMTLGYAIDPALCERFAEILARESAGHTAVLAENIDLKKKIQATHNDPVMGFKPYREQFYQ